MKKNIIVISGPSGVGKSTVIKEILKNSSIIEQSISDTTRNSRGNGDSYHFIDEEEFLNNLKSGIYVEHNYYNGNYYGINKEVLRAILQKGHIALVDCNTAGLQHLLADEEFQKHILSFYLVAEPEIIYSRLQHRKTETPESLMRRMQEGVTDLKVAGSGIYNIIFSTDDGNPEDLAEKIIQACSGNLHIHSDYCSSELIVLSKNMTILCNEISTR